MNGWRYVAANTMVQAQSIVERDLPDGCHESRSVDDPEVAAWIKAGGKPSPASGDGDA